MILRNQMQNINKFKVTLVLVVALVLVFVGVKGYLLKPDTSVIKIGGISALSGVGVGIGIEENRGAQLAVAEINARGGISGHPVELISEDVSIDKIKDSISAVRKLIDTDKVVAIVGPQWDEPAVPILPIIEGSKIPIVGPDSSPMLKSVTDYKYLFSTWYDNKVGVREVLRFAQKKNLKRITIVKPVAAGFWEYTASIFRKEAPNYGVTVVDEIDIGNPITMDFRTNILKAMEKNPEAIFIVTSDYNQCAFLKQAGEMGYQGITLGTESSGDPVSITQCPKLMEKRFWSTPVQSSEYKLFAERFKTQFGDYPRFPSAATAYDAVMAIAHGLERSHLKGGESLRDALTKTNIKGVGLENISFANNGFANTPENTYEIQTVKDGKFVRASY